MSQIALLSSGGPATAIVTLTGDTGGAVGIDAANNINIQGGIGINVDGNPATNTLTASLDGYTQGTAQTIGAVTADVITLDLGAVPSSWIIEAKVTGFEATLPMGNGYNLIGSARTDGAVATLNAIQDKVVFEGAGLVACDANLLVVGNAIVVRVTGTAGLTINWKSVTVAKGV